MKKIILLIYLFVSLNTFSQEYQITNVPVIQYSIDRFTNEIYYQHEFTEEVFKTNSIGSYHILTEFTSVPQFANNSHTAVYIDRHSQTNKDLYLHDFEQDTSYFLVNNPYLGKNLLFSPSDDKIMVSADIQVNIIYYSFEDSSIHDPGITIFPWSMEWLTDTTIIYTSLENEILVLNIDNLGFDTLVVLPDTVILRGLAHNANINAFAYSQEYYYTVENSLINMYYLSNGVDTTVYNFLEDGPSLGGFSIFIRSLTWERNTNKLGFIGEVILNPFSFIYAFDYSSSKTYQYSNWVNSDGIKYNLQWLNNDTVIYSDYTDERLLFGLDVTTPVKVKNELSEDVTDYELFLNYPNPFNPTTRIKFTLAPSLFLGERVSEGRVRATLKVYDILGREIATLVNEEKQAGEYEVEFNGSNLPSGIYFYQLKAGNYIETKKMVLLK